MPPPTPSRLPYPPPNRKPGETRRAFQARLARWDAETNGGRRAPRRGDAPASTRRRGGGGVADGPARRDVPNFAGDRESDRDRTYADSEMGGIGGRGGATVGGVPVGQSRGRGGRTSTRPRPPSPYGPPATPTYNSGNPFGFEPGKAGGSVGWGTTAANEPGWGDADKPTTTTVDYDARQAAEWLLNLSSTSPGEYADMVYQLWQAGFLGGSREELITGVFTRDVSEAFQDLYDQVDVLNRGGNKTTIFEYLDSRIQGRIESGALDENGDPASEAPPPRSYTDPETLRASVRAASEDVLGRRLSDEEADRFASHFRGLENSAYDASEAERDYTAPDVAGQSQEYLEENNPNEASRKRTGDYMAALQRMMGVGGSS